MMKKYIKTVLKPFKNRTSNHEIRVSENILVSLFGTILMIVGSFASFLSLHFFMGIPVSVLWLDTIITLTMGFILIAIMILCKNEIMKTRIMSVVFALYIVFTWVTFYEFIGPAVLTIAIFVILISLIYKSKMMLYVVLSITLMMEIGTGINHIEFTNWDTFYQSELVLLILFGFLVSTIHSINSWRVKELQIQYHNTDSMKQKLYSTLKSVADGVITIDANKNIELMNPTAQALTGWDEVEVVGKDFNDIFHCVLESSQEERIYVLDKVFSSEEVVSYELNTALIAKDGSMKSIELIASPIVDEHKIIIGSVIVFRDFTERKERQKEIEYISYHDQLTGLKNRRYFEKELQSIDIPSNLPISIIFADVNGLKIVNDAFGHEYGDKLIQHTADNLTTTFRKSDSISRVGGDEFVVLLPNTNEKVAQMLVERAITKANLIEINEVKTSVSFGVDTKTEESQLLTDVLKQSEVNMYQQKITVRSSVRNGIISTILNTLNLKCPREEAHSIRVGKICELIGKAYGLDSTVVANLGVLGSIHDIGKIIIDERILNSSESLSQSDFDQIRKHPEIGSRLLGASNEFKNLAKDVLQHHERWDGTGYPNKLKANEISWNARVVAIADAYDAIISERPYKKTLTHEEALKEIKKNIGTQFDPEIANVFINVVADLLNESVSTIVCNSKSDFKEQ